MVHVNQDFMKDVCIDDMVYKGLVWICFNLCLQSVFSQYSDQPCLRQLTSDTVQRLINDRHKLELFGLGSPSIVPNLKYLVRSYKPEGIILSEKMTTANKIEKLSIFYLLSTVSLQIELVEDEVQLTVGKKISWRGGLCNDSWNLLIVPSVTLSWCVIGDLNDIQTVEEKKEDQGGNLLYFKAFDKQFLMLVLLIFQWVFLHLVQKFRYRLCS